MTLAYDIPVIMSVRNQSDLYKLEMRKTILGDKWDTELGTGYVSGIVRQ